MISYHKKDFLLKDDILTPIHAGRAGALKKGPSPVLDWLLENMIGDDTGDNISEKNGSYNEMTSVYWVWKNYEKIGNPDWIGFMHYRRHFYFLGGERSSYENEGIYPGYLDEIGYSPDELKKVLCKSDFVTVKPQYRQSLYEHYCNNHRGEDLDNAICILKEKYPEYANAADTYLSGQGAYFCNMFIFPREVFFRYASWIFDILFAFEAETDLTEKRLFISEWLTGIFIQKLLEEGKKGTFLPTIYAEVERVIPVVMAADENYAIPMSVTIASLLQNAKKQTKYHIYILVPEEFSDSSRIQLEKFEEKYPGCQIEFIAINNFFDDYNISIAHITKVTYYRLLLPALLPECAKCIYMDTDVIVNTDLTNYFRTNVDDFYVAGVKAAGYMYPAWKIKFETERTNLPTIDQYINAGVVILNLARIRKHNIDKAFLELAKQPLQSMDQDVLNISCYGNIKILPPKFNLMNKYIRNGEKTYEFNEIGCHVYSEYDRKQALNQLTIIHYADKKKPWNDPDCILGEYWWKYAKYSTFFHEQLYPKPSQKPTERELALIQERDNLKKENKVLTAKEQAMSKDLRDIEASASFRVGRMITYIPRKIRGGIWCVRENGLWYTIKLAVKKVVGKIGG